MKWSVAPSCFPMEAVKQSKFWRLRQIRRRRKALGAAEAGLEDIIEKIQGGWLDFDVAVTSPDAMKEVRKIARVLGPKGLMPNPKAGTVSPKIEDAIKEVMAGRVEFKLDKGANLGVGIGKRSFSNDQLIENVRALMDAIGKHAHRISRAAISVVRACRGQ